MHGLRPPPQHKVSNRPAAKLLHSRHENSADAYAGAELLVCGFQPRRNIDRIAVSRVVEEAAAAKISHNCRSRMNTNTRDTKRDVIPLPTFAECLCVLIQSQRACNCASGMVRLIARGSEKHMQGIADNFCNRSIMRKNQ